MVKALFDTSILIDFLNGVPAAKAELDAYDTQFISRISWMEVMAGSTDANAAATRRFLAGFEMVEIDEALATRAVRIRKGKRLKLPDAVIAASAEVVGAVLVTLNWRDFGRDGLGVRVPY